MQTNKTFHHAFKVDYPGIVNVLKTEIGVSYPVMLNNDPNKPIIHTVAIWDTGATNTVISQNLVGLLELLPVDKTENFTAGGIIETNVYYVDVLLPNNVLFQNVRVTEATLDGFDVLVGMDIICAGDFAIANAGGKTHFSYCCPPHKNKICLYEKSMKVNPKS